MHAKRSRYIYLAYQLDIEPECLEDKENTHFQGFYKFDTKLDKVVADVSFGKDCRGGEV